MEKQQNEINLREYFRIIWQGKWLILSLFLLSLLLTWIYFGLMKDPIYESEVQIMLNNTEGNYSDPGVASRVIKSNILVGEALKELGQEFSLQSIKNFINNNIKISITDQSLIVKVRHKEPQMAKMILDKIIEKYMVRSRKQFDSIIDAKEEYYISLKQELEELNQRIKMVNENIDMFSSIEDPVQKAIMATDQLDKLDLYNKQKIDILEKLQEVSYDISILKPAEILDQAYMPEEPIDRNIGLKISLIGLLSLVLGVFIVFFKEFITTDIND